MGIDKTIPQFKVWDNENKEWVNENFLLIDCNNDVFSFDNESKYMPDNVYALEQLANTTICRFTGLFDKNNVPIYENDVCIEYYRDPTGKLHKNEENGRYLVQFKHGQFGLKMIEHEALKEYCNYSRGEYISNYGNPKIYTDITLLSTAGNALSNPELLEAGEWENTVHINQNQNKNFLYAYKA